jgi:hypothetical protein
MSSVRWRPFVAAVAFALATSVAAACGSGSNGATTTARTPLTTSASSPVTPTTVVSTTATTGPPSTATIPQYVPPATPTALFSRAAAALSHEGKVTHLTANLTSTFPSPDPRATPSSPPTTSKATVDAWFDPAKPVVRVEHREPPDAKPEVNILGADSGMSPETPIGVVLLWALATRPNLSVPTGMTIHAGVENGRPLTVLEYSMEATSETAAQAAKVVFDAKDLPVGETRVGTGDDAGWTQRIAYQTEFIDPKTLPDDYFDATAQSPPETLPADMFPAPEEFTAKVAELAGQGLNVAWLGKTFAGTQFGGLSDLFPGSPEAVINYYSADYSGPVIDINITETTAANWPNLKAQMPDFSVIESTGERVPGLGDKAFLGRTEYFGPEGVLLVVFKGDLVVVIQLGTLSGTAPETNAKAIEAAKALKPFSTS